MRKRGRFNLQNLDTDAYLMNLDNNPANDPWRNGMTDDQLMNLITLQGAKDLYGKVKGTGLFNLEQDLDLQNLGILKDLETRKNFQEKVFGNQQPKSKYSDLGLQNLMPPSAWHARCCSYAPNDAPLGCRPDCV